MSVTHPPVKQRNRHPIWRGLLCLVLGFGAWWGVARWLEPKPIWVKVIPTESKALVPLVDDRSKNMLVCLESKRGMRPHSEAMVILNLNRGEELHRTALAENISSLMSYADETWRPRFVGQHLCWLNQLNSQDRSVELRVWNFQNAEKNRAVQNWQLPEAFRPRVYFPSKSRVIIVQQTFPLQYIIAMSSQSLGMRLIAGCEWPRLIRWYETWSVPETPDGSVKLLARWSPPIERWQTEISLSEDGRWAAFAESTNSYSTIAKKARATGRKEFSGDDLFKLYQSAPSGLLVYDTTTGKQRHRLTITGKGIPGVYWAGELLCAYVCGLPKGFSQTLKEINEAVKKAGNNSDPYVELDREYFLVNAESLTRIACPKGCEESLCYLRMINGTLTLFDQGNHLIHEVVLQGDHLVIQHSLAYFDGFDELNFWWVRGSGQRVSSSKVPRPEIKLLREWAERWPFLTTFADWLEGDTKPTLSIQGPQYETTLSLKPYQEVWNLRVNDFSQLYLWGYATRQPEPKDYTLQAYALPIKLHSPWWGRSLGLFVFFLTLFLLSWQAHSRVTHQNMTV